MNKEYKKMVVWIDFEHDFSRTPIQNTIILMVVNYEVVIGYYDLKLGFQQLPVECGLSNHINAKTVIPSFWAYMPKHPFVV